MTKEMETELKAKNNALAKNVKKQVGKFVSDNEDNIRNEVHQQLNSILTKDNLEKLINDNLDKQDFIDKISKKILTSVRQLLNIGFNTEFSFGTMTHEPSGDYAKHVYNKLQKDYLNEDKLDKAIKDNYEEINELSVNKIKACMRKYLQSSEFNDMVEEKLKPLANKLLKELISQKEVQQQLQNTIKNQLVKTIKKASFNF